METLGRFLRNARLSQKIKAREVARVVGVSPAMVSFVERRGRVPSVAPLLRWARLLGLDEDRVLSLANRVHPQVKSAYLRRPGPVRRVCEELEREELRAKWDNQMRARPSWKRKIIDRIAEEE